MLCVTAEAPPVDRSVVAPRRDDLRGEVVLGVTQLVLSV